MLDTSRPWALEFNPHNSRLSPFNVDYIFISRYDNLLSQGPVLRGVVMMVGHTMRKKMTDLDDLKTAAECLRILAHPHRLRIVQMLLQDEYTVGELAEACGIASHMASEHLRLMQRCGFLDSAKDGRYRYYRVVEPHLANIMECVEKRFDRC